MIPFIYSKKQTSTKPSKTEVAPYQKASNYIFAECGVDDIAKYIGRGSAWRAGIYDTDITSFKKTNVKGAHILALDFDNCAATPEDVITYAETIGIAPNLYYYSYSQGVKPNNNFRVLWIFNKLMKPTEYENLYIIMLEQFKQFSPDNATKDCSRLWYGTTKSVHVCQYELCDIALAGWLIICEKVRQGIASNNIRQTKKAGIAEYYDKALPESQGVKAYWYEQMHGKCYLWDRWENGLSTPNRTEIMRCRLF